MAAHGSCVSPMAEKLGCFRNQREISEFGEAFSSASRRHWVGVWPVASLKARLKGPSEPKPRSKATAATVVRAWPGSDRMRLAASMRRALTKAAKLR